MLRNSRPYCAKMVPAQTTGRMPASLKYGNNCLLLFLLLTASLFIAGCGNRTVSLDGSGQPPFNIGSGEGNLVSEQLVTTYPTVSNSTQTGLDSFYTQTICPSTLTAQNCATNEESLNTAEFGNFDVTADPIANNSLGIKLVDAVKIDYTAMNVDQTPVTVSGGIAIPEIAPASIKGIILYFHGTTVQRTNVPSNFLATTAATYTDGTLLAAVWASQGYIVVMPDYIGLGDDTAHIHPYVVYPAQNAQTGLAMLNAARSVLTTKYQITANLPLYITGYSEGGAYALEAAHLMQDNPKYASTFNVQLKAALPLSGFFDLSGTGLSYLFYNMNPGDNSNPYYAYSPLTSIASKPYLSAYLTLSFANYAGIAPTAILASSFYNYPCSTSPCNNLDQLYFTNPQYSGYDTTAITLADAQAENAGWTVYTDNAITPLLTPAYATALMQKDTTNALYKQVLSADTYKFTPHFPVALLSLQQDSVVTRVNSDVAYTYFKQQNSKGLYQEILVPNSDFMISDGEYLPNEEVDHITEMPFMSLLILNQINTIQ
jgi:hypothetical protein